MRASSSFWSLAILAPLFLVPVAAGGLLPSLATLGQIVVACLGVFALWVGLAPERR